MEKDILKEVKSFIKEAGIQASKQLPPPESKSNMTELQIIQYLIKNEDRIVYVSDLVDSLNMRKSSITERLDIMEDKGIILRTTDEDDKRKKRVVLTEKAIEKKKEIENVFISLSEKMLDGIEEEKINIFHEVLETMERNLKK